MTEVLVSIAGVVIMVAIGLWIRTYLPAYMSEKGKNLATKEDIGLLTHKVEAVKLHYQRAGVVSEAQFEAEFKTYEEIWECLIDVQRTALSLRPAVDTGLREGETNEQRQQQRLDEFAEAFNTFTRTYLKRRPFYPDQIFQELAALAALARGEAIDYQFGEPRLDRGYWKQAHENAQKISDQVDQICKVIRERLAALSAA